METIPFSELKSNWTLDRKVTGKIWICLKCICLSFNQKPYKYHIFTTKIESRGFWKKKKSILTQCIFRNKRKRNHRNSWFLLMYSRKMVSVGLRERYLTIAYLRLCCRMRYLSNSSIWIYNQSQNILRLALVFVWNSTLRERFHWYFLELFC